MESEAFDEAVEGPSTTLGKVGAEAVASDVGEVILFGQRRYSARRVFFEEGVAEEDEICETSSYCKFGLLKGLEVGLRAHVSMQLQFPAILNKHLW